MRTFFKSFQTSGWRLSGFLYLFSVLESSRTVEPSSFFNLGKVNLCVPTTAMENNVLFSLKLFAKYLVYKLHLLCAYLYIWVCSITIIIVSVIVAVIMALGF